MPRYKTIHWAMVLAFVAILCLLLGGCGSASKAGDSRSLAEDPTPTGAPAASGVSSAPAGVAIEGTAISAGAANTGEPLTATDQPPAGTQEPVYQELIIGEQGFGQSASQLTYGFEIQNPNSVVLAGNTFQILAYDADGGLLGSEEENIPLLLPHQFVGIAGSFEIDTNSIVDNLLLRVTAGDAIELAVQPELEVMTVNYRPSEIYERVSGLVRNAGNVELEDIRISAIAYADDGQIVGAGYTFLSFLPAGSAAGVDIVLTTNEAVERVELFPRASLADLLQSGLGRPQLTYELNILDSGFSQTGIEVGYGFLVTNHNLLYALENSEYRVTFLNERDDVIAVDEGQIDWLTPQQIFGIGDHVFIDDGETVGRMDVLVRASNYRQAAPKPGLSAENVTVFSNTLGTIVSGDIVNPYQVALDNVRVTALVYDDEGRLIGGGFDWIDALPPAGLSPVEVWVSANNAVDTAELFAGISEYIQE